MSSDLRLDDTMSLEVTGLSRTISEIYTSQVFVTPSGMLNLPHFKFIHEVIGADHMLFSVDYPYATTTGARRFLEQLPVSQEDKEKIAHRNAELLLGLDRRGGTAPAARRPPNQRPQGAAGGSRFSRYNTVNPLIKDVLCARITHVGAIAAGDEILSVTI
jgi:hypothetical protein